jgi:hypothetical protein
MALRSRSAILPDRNLIRRFEEIEVMKELRSCRSSEVQEAVLRCQETERLTLHGDSPGGNSNGYTCYTRQYPCQVGTSKEFEGLPEFRIEKL